MVGREFYGCYLLESKNPRAKGRSYIGFTVNPRRRIRQHNGEIVNGANKTKSLRPWEMVLVVYGFPTQVQALQFEWSWQHPERSLDIRSVAARLGRKARYGVHGKVLLLMEMLNTEPWCYYPLTVQFLSSRVSAERGRCPPPPPHMRVLVAPMEALPEVVEDAADPAEVDENGGGDDLEDEEAEVEGGSLSGGSDLDLDESLSSRLGTLATQHQQQPQRAAGGSDGLGSAAGPALSVAAWEQQQQLQEEEEEGEDEGAVGAKGKKRGKKGKGNGAGGARGAAAAAARALSACMVCSSAANRTWAVCAGCGKRSHVECLARSLLEAEGASAGTLPGRGQCPSCARPLVWMDVLASLQNAGWENKSKRGRADSKSKAQAAKAGSAAAAAAPGSISEAAAVGAAGKKKGGGRGSKAGGAPATDASAGLPLDGEGQLAGAMEPAPAAAGRGAKPRGRRKAAPPAAEQEAGLPVGAAPGGSVLLPGGFDQLGDAAAAPAAERRGRPRRADSPASAGTIGQAAGATSAMAAAPQQQPRRRQRGAGAASTGAQLQAVRSLWGTAEAPAAAAGPAAEAPIEILEAAPWEDFGSPYEPYAPYEPDDSHAGSGGDALGHGRLYSAGAADAPGAQWAEAGGAARAQPRRPPAWASEEGEDVVVLSDSDSDPGADASLMPLAERLLQQRWQQQVPWGESAAAQRPPLPSSPLRPGSGTFSPQGALGGSPAFGAAIPEQQPRWDSPPTHALNVFQLASPSPSPTGDPLRDRHPSQQRQQQRQQQQQGNWPARGSPAALFASDCRSPRHSSWPAAPSPMHLEEGEAGRAGPTFPAPPARPAAAAAEREGPHWVDAGPMLASPPVAPALERQVGVGPLMGAPSTAPAGPCQQGQGELIELLNPDPERSPGFQWVPQHSQDRHAEQQGRRRRRQQQPEVIELVSPSPLPLRDRIQQGGQAAPLQHLPAAGGGALPAQSCGAAAAASSQAAHAHQQQQRRRPQQEVHRPAFPAAFPLQQSVESAGGGTSREVSAAEGSPGRLGAPAASGADGPVAGAKPKRPRAYARNRRRGVQPQPLSPSAGLGIALAPGKSRGLASPRFTPSPAPLRKRVQQQQGKQQGGGSGGGERGPLSPAGKPMWQQEPFWQPRLVGGASQEGPLGGGSAGGSQQQQQQQQRGGGAPSGTRGGVGPAWQDGPFGREDDVIVISD